MNPELGGLLLGSSWRCWLSAGPPGSRVLISICVDMYIYSTYIYIYVCIYIYYQGAQYQLIEGCTLNDVGINDMICGVFLLCKTVRPKKYQHYFEVYVQVSSYMGKRGPSER